MRNLLKLAGLFLLLSFTHACTQKDSSGLFGLRQIPQDSLPVYITLQGEWVDGIAWQDRGGENIVFLSKLTDTSGKVSLLASQFIKEETDSVFLEWWQVNDSIQACSGSLAIVPKSLQIVDADDNEIAEIYFMYDTGCEKEQYKMSMHSNGNEYWIRGDNEVVSENTVPARFTDSAVEVWNESLGIK